MKLIKAEEKHVSDLVRISKEAFDSDIAVGAAKAGGPPDYNSYDWHLKMMEKGHLLTAVEEKRIVGGAIVFEDINNISMYVGRIFVDPAFFRRGYGVRIMEELELIYPNIITWKLDTPVWNQRTNNFYKKLGYVETHREDETVNYQKIISGHVL